MSKRLDFEKVITIDKKLLSITLDQLRSLYAVFKKESIRKGAKSLKREHASVDKQIDTLNKRFSEYSAGENLAHSLRKYGSPVSFSKSGDRVVKLAEDILDAMINTCQDLRRLNKIINVASTTFLIPLVCDIWKVWREKIDPDFRVEIEHVHSQKIPNILREKPSIDLCFGGMLANENGLLYDLNGYDYIEYNRDEIGILTNLPEERLGKEPIDIEDVYSKDLLFILPDKGIIHEFIQKIDVDFEKKIKRLECAQDVFFIVTLLQYDIYKACIFCHKEIYEWAKKSTRGLGLEHENLRFINLHQKKPIIEVSAGLFRQKGIFDSYKEDHPLNLCWNIYKSWVQEKKKCNNNN